MSNKSKSKFSEFIVFFFSRQKKKKIKSFGRLTVEFFTKG